MKNLGRIKIIAPALLSFSLALQGCSVKSEAPVVVQEKQEEVIDEIKDEQAEVVEEETSYIDSIDTSDLTLTDSPYDYWHIESLNLDYEGEEYYLTMDEVTNIISIANNQPEKPREEFSGNVEEVINIIINNSSSTPRENCISIFDTEYKDLAIDALRETLTDIFTLGTNDTMEDYNTIKDVKIYIPDPNYQGFNPSWTFAITNQSGRDVVFYPSAITTLATTNGETFEAAFKYNMKHEFNHIRQTLSTEEKEMGKGIYSFDYRNTASTFTAESSAESELYAYGRNNTSIRTYPEEREAEAELMLLALPNPDNKIENYYNSIFDNDLRGLYEFYNLENDEDIYKYYRILYAMDARFRRNDFVNNYYSANNPQGSNEVLDTDLRSTIGYEYKQELFLLFTSKLINYIDEHHEVSLEEALILFNIAKNSITNDKLNNGLEYPSEYVEKMNEYENMFIEYLSTSYNYPVENIREKERDSVYFIIDNLNKLSRGEEVDSSVHAKKAEIIINKYPVTRIILQGDKIEQTQFNEFVEGNRLKR